MCIYLHMCAGQKRVSAPWNWSNQQSVLRPLLWVPGSKLISCTRAVRALNCWPMFPLQISVLGPFSYTLSWKDKWLPSLCWMDFLIEAQCFLSFWMPVREKTGCSLSQRAKIETKTYNHTNRYVIVLMNCPILAPLCWFHVFQRRYIGTYRWAGSQHWWMK